MHHGIYALCLVALWNQQQFWANLEGEGDSAQIPNCDIFFCTLHLPDVRAMQSRELSKSLLRQISAFAKGSHIGAHYFFYLHGNRIEKGCLLIDSLLIA